MKKPIWFQTDLGYEATRQKLAQDKNVIGDMEAYKGRLTFHFKNLKDYTVQITTNGKLGIFYPENSDFNVILEQLKPYLVKPDGSQAEITGIIEKPSIPKTEAEKPSTETQKECDYEFLKYCIQQGWITQEEIEAISESKSLADNYPGLKPLYDSLRSKIEVLKDIKEKLKG